LPHRLSKTSDFDTIALAYLRSKPLDFADLLGLNAFGIFPSTL
jgi:hypothetical protein